MLVPVWSATWEIECCQPEAEVGKEWAMPVCFAPGPDPWWVTDFGGVATEEQRALGVLKIDGVRVQEVPGTDEAIMQAGPLRFRVDATTPEGAGVGRLYVDAHPVSEAIPRDDVLVRGVVEAIDLVPVRYRRSDKFRIPSEQLDAVPAQSTLERSLVEAGDPNGWEDTVGVELLVWLRTSDD